MPNENPNRTTVSVYMDRPDIADMDSIAARFGVSRSELMRKVLARYISKMKEKEELAKKARV